MASQSPVAQPLKSYHNVARYCRPRWIVNGIVSRDAFLMRQGEQFLSTNWLESFPQSEREAQISGVRAVLTNKNFSIHSSGGFAVLNVGDTIYRVWSLHGVLLLFRALGEARDPSHTGIFGYGAATVDPKGNDVAQSLAASVLELHPAIS